TREGVEGTSIAIDGHAQVLVSPEGATYAGVNINDVSNGSPISRHQRITHLFVTKSFQSGTPGPKGCGRVITLKEGTYRKPPFMTNTLGTTATRGDTMAEPRRAVPSNVRHPSEPA